jgi:sodium-dependent phosphate cotransporter
MLPSDVGEGEKWEGPIKKIVSPFGSLFIIANKEMIDSIASSDGNVTCGNFYPVTCIGGKETYETCKAGLIGCDSDTNKCPIFFQNGATQNDDIVSGWVCLIFSLFLLIGCLIGIVTLLRFMLLGASQRIIYKATNINGYVAMMIGCGSTILVQSSSITISTLVPLVGMGVLQLEQVNRSARVELIFLHQRFIVTKSILFVAVELFIDVSTDFRCRRRNHIHCINGGDGIE